MKISVNDIDDYLNSLYGALQDTPFLRAMRISPEDPEKVFFGKNGIETPDESGMIECGGISVDKEWSFMDIHSSIDDIVKGAPYDACCKTAAGHWLLECGIAIEETTGERPAWLNRKDSHWDALAPEVDARNIGKCAKEVFASDPETMSHIESRLDHIDPFTLEWEAGSDADSMPLIMLSKGQFGDVSSLSAVRRAVRNRNDTPRAKSQASPK